MSRKNLTRILGRHRFGHRSRQETVNKPEVAGLISGVFYLKFSPSKECVHSSDVKAFGIVEPTESCSNRRKLCLICFWTLYVSKESHTDSWQTSIWASKSTGDGQFERGRRSWSTTGRILFKVFSILEVRLNSRRQSI